MPLGNNTDKEWTGWLIDNLSGKEADFQSALVATLEARKIPSGEIKTGTVNMWWRRDSRYVDVLSTMDGNIMATIHIQAYGSSLWIGRAVEPRANWNYYKRMAASAFVLTVDRCIVETILDMAEAEAVHDVPDKK